MTVVETRSAAETRALGQAIGEIAVPGLVIAFSGGLGAGKTTFAKGLARGLGVEDEVTSPTYTIAAEYEGRLPLRHVDAYRLRSPEEFEEAGAELWLAADGVCLVEWSENVGAALPKDAVSVELIVSGDEDRRIVFRGEALEGVPGFAEALERLGLVRAGSPV